jgi:hypothetical protein
MKNLKTFTEFINESKLNEAFATFDADRPTLQARLDGVEEDAAGEGITPDEMGVDMKLWRNQFDLASKALKTPLNKCATTDSEGSYELAIALNVGLRKRRDAGDSNIELVAEIPFNSPWKSSNSKNIMSHYRIVDAKLDVITYEDGDDYADFQSIIFPENQKAKLLKWVNTNMSEDDMTF